MSGRMPADRTRRLAADPVGPLFLRLAVPAVLGQLAVLVNNVVDRMWVGHIPHDGALALGAVGISLPIHHLFLALILMLAVGVSTSVSIWLGKGDRIRAARVSGSCFGLAICVNVAAVAVILTFADALLMRFGAGETSLPFARSYLVTIAWGMPFSNTLLMLTMWLNAQGYVSEGVRLNLVNVVVNLVLDPVFIFACGLGVAGAAIATNLGAIAACACGCRLVGRNPHILRFAFRDLVPRLEYFLPSVALGLSTLLNVGMESLALLYQNAALQAYGGDLAVASLSLFGVPLLILMNLCLGLSHGAQPIISYNYGARRPDRVADVSRRFILACFVCSFVLWAAAMAAPRALWSCFSSDVRLIDFASAKTRLFFAVMLTGGVQYAHIYVIKFLSFVRTSLFLGVLKRLLLLLPLIFILPAVWPGDKTTAVLLASPLSDGLAFVVTALCYLAVMRRIKGRKTE